MTNSKRVTLRGSRRSKLLGARDPRIRRAAQESWDPQADRKAKEIEARLKKLEEK